MLSTDVSIKFYSNPKMIALPVKQQAEIMDIVDEVFSSMEESNVVLSNLLSTDESTGFTESA